MAVLQYDFAVVGADKVHRAFASIERRAAVHNSKMNRLMGAAPRGAGGGRKSIDGAARAARAIEQKATRERIANERAVSRAAEKAARDKERAAKRYGQIQAKQHRADLAHIRRQRREADRAAMAAVRERRRVAGATMGRVGRSAGGALRAIGGTAAGALTLGGGLAAGVAVSSVMRQEAAATALANQAYRQGSGPSRDEIRRSVLNQSRQIGVSSGLGTESMIGSMRSVVSKSGRLDIAQKIAPFMADIANATDANIGDVGTTAGQIVQNLSAKNIYSDQEILEQTADIMASMAGQAKVGAIEFSDLAQQMGKVMSATSGYEGKVSDLAATMGAVAQLSLAGGAASPEEAMTSILRFRDDLIQNAGLKKALGKAGIDPFVAGSGNTKLRGPEGILFDILGKTGGDLTKVKKMFGIRAMKAVQPFQEAYVAGGGGEAGMKSVRQVLDSVRGAKMSRKEIAGSAAFRVAQTDRQAAVAFEDFKVTVGKELLPELVKLIPVFKELVPSVGVAARVFAKLVESLVNSPLTTIGTLIASKVVADIAMARIGESMKNAITGSAAGVGVSGTGGGAGGFLGPAAKGALGGAAINGLSIGAVTGMVIYAKGVTEFHASEQRMAKGGDAVLRAEAAAAAGDVKSARAAWRETRDLTDKAQEKSGMEQLLSGATSLMKMGTIPGMLASPFMGGVGTESQIAESTGMATERRTAEANEARARAAMIEAEKKAASALEAAAKNMANTGGPNRSDTPTLTGN